MNKPKKAGSEPMEVQLEQGKTYAWCACGESSNQPFCDGSHKVTEFKPNVFKAEESRTVWLCMCKRTGNSPFCDGTHSTL